ncbi:MAG: hypothetical protein ACLUFE_13770 [Anaerostipes hadrus]
MSNDREGSHLILEEKEWSKNIFQSVLILYQRKISNYFISHCPIF